MGNQQSQSSLAGKIQSRKDKILRGGERQKSEKGEPNSLGPGTAGALSSSRVTSTGGRCTLPSALNVLPLLSVVVRGCGMVSPSALSSCEGAAWSPSCQATWRGRVAAWRGAQGRVLHARDETSHPRGRNLACAGTRSSNCEGRVSCDTKIAARGHDLPSARRLAHLRSALRRLGCAFPRLRGAPLRILGVFIRPLGVLLHLRGAVFDLPGTLLRLRGATATARWSRMSSAIISPSRRDVGVASYVSVAISWSRILSGHSRRTVVARGLVSVRGAPRRKPPRRVPRCLVV